MKIEIKLNNYFVNEGRRFNLQAMDFYGIIFFCQVYMLTKEEGGRTKPVTTFQQLQMFSKTFDVACQTIIEGKEMLMPGEDAP